MNTLTKDIIQSHLPFILITNLVYLVYCFSLREGNVDGVIPTLIGSFVPLLIDLFKGRVK